MSQPFNNSQVLDNDPSQQARITRRQSKEKCLVVLPPLSFPKRSIPPPEPLPDRFQCLSKSNFENLNCPRHNHPVTLVCTDITCLFHRLGCLECLRYVHDRHIVISLDRFVEMIPKLQVKESERQFQASMNELRHAVNDCIEVLDSEINSRTTCKKFFGSSFERINLTLRLLEYQLRINQSDVLSLKTNMPSQYAVMHWLFGQSNMPVYDCIEFFARIAYHPHVEALTEQVLTHWELASNMQSFDRKRNILKPNILEQSQQSNTNAPSKSISQKDSLLIFSSVEDACSQSDRINKQLWKVTEKKMVPVKQSKELQTTATTEQKKEQTIHKNQEKGKKRTWKRLIQDEIKEDEKDQMAFQDGNCRKKRKLNDTAKDSNYKIGLKSPEVSKPCMERGDELEKKHKKGRGSTTQEIDEKLKQKEEMKNSLDNPGEDKQNNLNRIDVTERRTWQARTRSGTRREELIQQQIQKEQKKMLQRGTNKKNKKDEKKHLDLAKENQEVSRRDIHKNSRKEQIAKREEAQEIEGDDDDPTVIDKQEESLDISLEIEGNQNQEKSQIPQNNGNGNDQGNYQIIPNNDESFSYETVSSSLGFLEEDELDYQARKHLTVSESNRDGKIKKPNYDFSFELSGLEDNDDAEEHPQSQQDNGKKKIAWTKRNNTTSNKSNQPSKCIAKNNAVSNSTNNRTPTSQQIAITAQMSEQQFMQMKQQALSESAKHHQLMNLLNKEFDRQKQLSSLDNSSQSNEQQQSKCILKYRYIGVRRMRLSTGIRDFEEYLQEGDDQIIISYSNIFQEIQKLLSWVRFQFCPLIRNYCPTYSCTQSFSRCIAHYTDGNIRKTIASMAFIRCSETNKNVFLTIDQQSEMKFWEINSSNDIKLVSQTNIDQYQLNPNVIISPGQRSFLIGGELYHDGGCSLFRLCSSTNTCNYLSHYKIKCGKADVPFVGLIVQGKMVVIQKRNQYTRIGLYNPAIRKYIRHYQFYYGFDHAEFVHNAENLLGMSCSEYSRFGVLDLVSGKNIFTNLVRSESGQYAIQKSYAFLDASKGINFAVSMRLKAENTRNIAASQRQRAVVRSQVESAEVATKTKEQFRFEIYKITKKQKKKNPFWERFYVQADNVQVIQMQYSSSLDSLILLEGSSCQECHHDVLKYEEYEEQLQNQGKKYQKPLFNRYSLVMFDMKKGVKYHLMTQVSNSLDKAPFIWNIMIDFSAVQKVCNILMIDICLNQTYEIFGFILNEKTNQLVLSMKNSILRVYQLNVSPQTMPMMMIKR